VISGDRRWLLEIHSHASVTWVMDDFTMGIKGFFQLLKETFSDWSEDKVPRLAAALAYYTVFSLAPLLVIVIAIAGLFGASDAVQSGVMTQIQDLVGTEGEQFIGSMIQNANQRPATGIVATVVGTVTLLIGALGVFGELQNSMNTIWEVKPKPAKGLKDTVVRLILGRLVSFAMLLVIGFLLLTSLLLSSGLAALGDYIGGLLPFSEFFLQALNFVISFGVITVLFALIFKFMPDAHIAWRDVWLGAAVTSLLFTLGKFALGMYLGKSDVGSSFGAAGSLALILIWIYYSAQIVFFGAEFTQVYANRYGSKIVPDEDAVKVSEDERAQQGIPHRETLDQVAPGTASSLGAGRRSWHTPALTYASIRRRREGIFDRVLHGFLLATQFIPALRSQYAAKAKRTRTTKTAAGPGTPARS
jgi:membrane protein